MSVVTTNQGMTIYARNELGGWDCCRYPPRCALGSRTRCQGVDGHDGAHWYYDDGGYYVLESETGIEFFSPELDGWVHPKDNLFRYHVRLSVTTPVTDPTVIALLDAGGAPPGPDVYRQVDDDAAAATGL